MTLHRRMLNQRTLYTLALAGWVILLAFLSLRAERAGPQWGLHLANSAADGTTSVESVAPYALAAYNGVRHGDILVSVDDAEPGVFAGQDMPGTVHQIEFRDDSGAATVRFTDTSWSMIALLWGGALLFVGVGGVVYRWSADAVLGKVFLAFSASFGTALAAAPLARLGYSLALYLPSAAALTASPSLLVLFLMFPRRMRWVRPVALVSFTVAALLLCGQLAEPLLPRSQAEILDASAWIWVLINLLAALVVLGLRARHGPDRRALSPLIPGVAVGIAPLVLVTELPRLLGLGISVDPEISAIGMAAIPISFAYTILRYQVFGLDVLMRRIILRASHVAVGTLLFFAAWLLLHAVGLPFSGAALFAAAMCALLMPGLTTRLSKLLDAWLYHPLSSLDSSVHLDETDSLEHLAMELTGRLRQLLPVQWAACLLHDEMTPTDSASRRLLGADGQLPRWLDPDSSVQENPTEVSVTPVHRFDTGVVMLVCGPRLDGGRLDGIQLEAMRILGRRAGASFEAAVLRERAEEESAFREGLSQLARDLAAAATVSDVLRVFSYHAERLLHAESATLIRQGTEPEAAGVAVHSLDANVLQFELDNGTQQPVVCSVQRSPRADRFGTREEQRARELAEHTTGALRRAAEREILEEQLRHRAFYDSLTGLPNRALFLDRIGHAVARGERTADELAVLFIDLDRFKVINDSLGHAAGDQLLVQVGHRLRGCLRESDTIARLGGDEFTVLLEGVTAVSDAVNAAERILLVLREPFVIEGQETYASASVGIAGGTAIRENGRDLLREADIALYRAKAAGRSRYTIFEPTMSQVSAGDYLHLESDLHRAVERGELRLHYQPIFSLRTSQVLGLEALVRWEHPEKGMIPPNQFIPLAEDTGLIVPIGKWVLEEACRQLGEWHALGLVKSDLSVSVNLSARQLQDPGLVQDVRQALKASRLDPHTLQLEITESVMMQEPELMVARLNELKALGLQLAVDDFGTGYSSLAYLKRFPIDVLKIDRAFVTGVANAGHDSAIVKTVVGLARALGLRTTAEGIEERSQWDRLEQLGCDNGQGFIFSRPLRPDSVRDLLVGRGDAPLNLAA